VTKSEFIEQIAAAAKKYAPQFNIQVISPIIAQACLESAYGTSTKAQHHNYFGLKYKQNRVTCHSGYFRDGGSEQNADGSYTPISADWYAFDSLDSGVLGYFQFINISRYSNVKGVTDPKKYLELIKQDGYATSLKYVDNVYNVILNNNLTRFDKEDESTMSYSNSSLVDCTVKSPNNSGTRTHTIDRITPHCVVGQLSAENIGNCFVKASRKASCNYGIGTDGRVCLVVDEANRSWCSSSSANDQRAVTIECASDKTAPYAFNDAVYNKLVDLCVDICKRNGKTKLLWIEDKNTALSYNPKSNEMLLTVHRWFANKSCPGDWMYARMGQLAETVTTKLAGGTTNTTTQSAQATTAAAFPQVPFTVEVLIDNLNYRSTPSDSGVVKGRTGKGKFTIVQTSGQWGKLKSSVGWIYLGNSNYVKIGSSVASSNTASSTSSSSGASAYIVQVTANALNIRKGPSTKYTVRGCIKNKGRFTIVDEENGWGLLKSYKTNRDGWINLKYTKKV